MVGTKRLFYYVEAKKKLSPLFQKLFTLMFSWFSYNTISVVITEIPLNDQTTLRMGISDQCKDEKHVSLLLHFYT